LEGDFRLSWDVPQVNRYEIEFERGRVAWTTNVADRISVTLNGTPYRLDSTLRQPVDGRDVEARGYISSFTAQWQDVVEAIREGSRPRVDGREATRALRLIDRLYATKKPMPMPHLPNDERIALEGIAR